MKLRTIHLGGAVFCVLLFSAADLQAGWRHLRGGGSSGSYGSSGYSSYGSSGYTASYGSSGYTSSYGSSGYTSSYGSSGYASSYGSSGYTSSYGSSGTYSSYGSSGAVASSGGSSGHPGLLSRIRSHFAAKRARRAAYASSGGSSGYGSSGYVTSYGSSGYASYSSGGSSGVSYRPSYGSSGTVSYSASSPVSYGSVGASYYSAAKPDMSAPIATLASEVRSDAVYLTVAVPSKAKIFVNDKPTTSTGAVRQFVSRGLKQDKTYSFKIRAELDSADGQTMVETKDVVVSAGTTENLQFAFADYDQSVETALTLNVPEGAQVTLAGNPTKAVGETRTYRTTGMKVGEVWDDYQVEVRIGQQVKRQAIRLIAGDKLELSFDFNDGESSKLASR